MSMFSITVPASTANLGPGFDSAGLALNLYLTLHVEKSEHWEFVHESVHLPPAPDASEHLIYKTAERTANLYHSTLPPCKVIMESDIPLARGLGSSASAIIAGIELANQLCELSLSIEEKLRIATDIEGHPDNVAASLYGGLVITSQLPNGDIEVFKKTDAELDFIVYIPVVELKTEDARKVLPEQFTRNEAAKASAVGNVMIAALVSGNYELAGKMMEEDLFHEPYRSSLIPNYSEIREEAKIAGAFGTVISGAGPTMISFTSKGKGQEVAAQLQNLLSSHQVSVLKMDSDGSSVNLDVNNFKAFGI
ncbi:homoserine kinase [Bacillus sp. FJAT-49732]|uniref:Homoserine kinase n=1 Tax=Lederbergia citrisecunda TaxID=2833583 RepID=A0A942TIN4_9BACI|nr:homoserine kinase [Lederbergia citrisecunda]MBS4198263.1 homoserine kinase [Lederbergia citrisecunda]